MNQRMQRTASNATRSALNLRHSCVPGLKQPGALCRNRFAVHRKSDRITDWLVLSMLVLMGSGRALQGQETLRPKLTSPEAVSAWDFDGNGTWQVSDGRLQLTKAGVPFGPIRRPAALAILKSEPFTKVKVELEVLSLAPVDVQRRDVELVLGYESASSFYYVHLSAVTDDVHNGIFIVANADRRRIDSGKGIPHLKDQSWHRVRATRDGETGLIEVFLDGSSAPILSAVDKTIKAGRVGVGSFDDIAEFRNIKVQGYR